MRGAKENVRRWLTGSVCTRSSSPLVTRSCTALTRWSVTSPETGTFAPFEASRG